MNKNELGVCYYPEHWDESLWEQDAKEMVSAGISWVRIAEFAWSRIEPSPGAFEWDWLDRAVEILAQNGLKIVMCTPTATPPRWIIDKHPDMLACDEDGHPRKFGSRRHYCFSHEGYREESRRITRLVAERYGQHPAVAAWQTDNEYGCHDTAVSWSPSARVAFQRWLEDKYATTDALNAAWGNVFWSMEYNRFDQVDLPYLTVTEANPAHRLDFRRFSSDQVASFNEEQVKLLRQLSPNRPIIHNFMGRFTQFDHYKVGDQLDVASWDSYPLGNLAEIYSKHGVAWEKGDFEEFMRQGEPDFQAFYHDLYRHAGGRLWIMEQQPGPVNWASYNPIPLDGMVRLWTFEAFAHGAEVVSYFRWRQAPFAQEQMHAGLKRPDNKEARAIIEARQVTEQKATLPELVVKQAPVALVFDYESMWAHSIQPQGRDFNYFRLAMAYYRAIRAQGIDVDIVRPSHVDFSGYKAAVLPALFAPSKQLAESLKQFKEEGGFILAGPRSGQKSENFSFSDQGHVLAGLFDGLDVDRVETLPETATRSVYSDDGTELGHLTIWQEEFSASGEMLLKDDRERPVAIKQDRAYYIGAWLQQPVLEVTVQAMLQEAGLNPVAMPKGVRRRQTANGTFYFNYSTKPVDLSSLQQSASFELDGTVLPPAGVSFVRSTAE